MRKRKTVVFGACGFVGSYLHDYFPDFLGIDIESNLGRKFKNKFVYGDIRKKRLFESLGLLFPGIECCINVSSFQPDYSTNGRKDLSRYIETNTIGTMNIMDFCVAYRIPKFIHVVSHRSVIGEYADEDAPYRIDYGSEFAEFAISEMAAMEMAKCYEKKFGLNTIILRVPSIIGYGSHLEGFREGKYYKTGLLTFIENAMNGLPIVVYGDPLAGRDIVYVKDVASAIMRAKESDVSGLYNISSGKILTLEEEVAVIKEVFCENGESAVIYDMAKRNDIEWCLYNIDKARKELNWNPKYLDFRDMMIDFRIEMKTGRQGFLVDTRKRKIAEAKTFFEGR